MGASESKVVVAPDSTGKAIRNLSVYTQVGDTPTLVQMQVVGLTDADGNLINPDTRPVLEELLDEQRRTREVLELLLEAIGADRGAAAGFQGRVALGPNAGPNALINGISDPFGRQIVLPWGARDMFVPGIATTITGTGATTLIAGVPDTYLDLVALVITNTSASTNSRVDVSDGTNTYAFQSVGGAGPVGLSSGLIIPATTRGTGWTVQAASSVTDLRIWALFVRNK